MKPLKTVSATDAFSAMLGITDVLAGKSALFVSATLHPDQITQDSSESVRDEVALVVESSGSTGVPKKIEIELKALISSAKASLDAIGGPGQWLLALPTNFIAGLQVLVRSALAETQPVLLNPNVAFSAEGFARSAFLMTGERRYTSLVPAQLDRLASAVSDEFVLAQLKRFDAILVGGQAANPATLSLLKSLGVNVIETYGMTETCGGCVYDGRALQGVKVRIESDGRIAIAGSVLANAQLGEWFVTNDLGEIDTADRLRVLGRADRVIVSGGIKLSLERVEEFARTIEGVTDACAVAIPHPQFGQSFICWVELAGSATNALELLRREASETLGKAAGQAHWVGIEAITRLANGKPDLVRMAALAEDFQKSLEV